jgi:hypothetical protein
MVTVGNARKSHLHLSDLAHPDDEKPSQPGKMIYGQAYSPNHQLLTVGCNSERIIFLTNEAGMSMKTKGRCGKLRSEAGSCMKTQVLSYSKPEC